MFRMAYRGPCVTGELITAADFNTIAAKTLDTLAAPVLPAAPMPDFKQVATAMAVAAIASPKKVSRRFLFGLR